jgi:hypothetical protein
MASFSFTKRPLYSRSGSLSNPMNRQEQTDTRTERHFADKGRRIEKVNRPRPPTGFTVSGRGRCGAAAGLDRPAASALILGWGALDEGKTQASDGWRDRRDTPQKKFYWRPDTNSIGEIIKGRLGRSYEAAELDRLRHKRHK